MVSTTCEYTTSPPSSRVRHLSDSSSPTPSGWDGEGGRSEVACCHAGGHPGPSRTWAHVAPSARHGSQSSLPVRPRSGVAVGADSQAASRKAPPSSPLLLAPHRLLRGGEQTLPASRPHPGLKFLFSRNVLALSGNSPDHGHPGAVIFPLTPPQAAVPHWGTWEEPQWV